MNNCDLRQVLMCLVGNIPPYSSTPPLTNSVFPTND